MEAGQYMLLSFSLNAAKSSDVGEEDGCLAVYQHTWRSCLGMNISSIGRTLVTLAFKNSDVRCDNSLPIVSCVISNLDIQSDFEVRIFDRYYTFASLSSSSQHLKPSENCPKIVIFQLLSYDTLLTISFEVEKIWKRKYTGLTILWFLVSTSLRSLPQDQNVNTLLEESMVYNSCPRPLYYYLYVRKKLISVFLTHFFYVAFFEQAWTEKVSTVSCLSSLAINIVIHFFIQKSILSASCS